MAVRNKKRKPERRPREKVSVDGIGMHAKEKKSGKDEDSGKRRGDGG